MGCPGPGQRDLGLSGGSPWLLVMSRLLSLLHGFSALISGVITPSIQFPLEEVPKVGLFS